MNLLTWIILGCMLLSNATAASFNCAKATSNVEKLICSDSGLSELDEKLSLAYKAAMKSAINPYLLRQEQMQWLQQRNACINVSCLVNTYATRTIQLTNPRTDWYPLSINSADAKACKTVAEQLNRNSLSKLFVHPANNPPSNKVIEQTFGGLAELGSYWILDLNNDGIKDQLLILVEGTAHFTNIYALSGENGAIPASLPADIDEVENGQIQFDPLNSAEVLSANGRNFIFDGYSLWNLTQDGKFQTVCQFNEIGKPVTNITKGNPNSVCSNILSSENGVHRVQYALEYGLGKPLSDEDRFYLFSRDSDIAGTRVDIDNDGKVENVVRLVYVFPGGRGCSATNLAVTDSSASHIPDTKLNDLLLNNLASHPCGPSLDMLIHDGTTYIDAIHNDISYIDTLDKGGHTIYRIKNNMAEVICEFRTRINVQAVGVSTKH